MLLKLGGVILLLDLSFLTGKKERKKEEKKNRNKQENRQKKEKIL